MRRTQLVPLVISAALLAGAGGAWSEALAEPEEAKPAPPNASAEESKAREQPGTERLGAALDDIAKEDPLLARVNGAEIRWTDIVESARNLPKEYRSQVEVIFPALLERLIDVRLIAWAGREAGLDRDEAVRERVAQFEDRLISEIFIRREVAERVTTEMLRARYDAYVEQLAAHAEVRARHILLDSEAEAREVIAALDDGADFVELARDRSLGSTAELGGDLDYFTRGNMTPAFVEAAFGLEVGEYSPEPVKTEFGWHVIKVEDRRVEEPLSFFKMRDRLRKSITHELMNDLLRSIRERAEIELYPKAGRVQ